MTATTTKPRKAAAKKPAKKAAKRTTKRAPAKPRAKRQPASTLPAMRATGKPRGRPPGITDPSLVDPERTVGMAIVDLVADGVDPREASVLAGVTPDILTNWVARGTTAWADLQTDPDAVLADEDGPFVALCEELAVAESRNVAELFLVARRYAERDARWHGAYLAMRHRDRFGGQRVEVTGANGGPVRQSVEVWSLAKLEAAVSVAEANARQRTIDATSRPAELTA